jgi:hypothetical protein
MNLFLLTTFIYRFANGLLFLAVAWNLVQSANGGAMPLALSAIGGFLPAVVAAPFARRLLESTDTAKLTLWGISGLCACALLFTPFLHIPAALVTINFMVLSIFFLLEGAWDALLAAIINRLPSSQSDKLNARQSAATQAGLMLGGLPLGWLVREGGTSAPFLTAAILYVIAMLLFAIPKLRLIVWSAAPKASTLTGEADAFNAAEITPSASWSVLTTLALVWPCLTLVNMTLPLVANAQGRGTVEHAALLDAAIGLGMACIGVLYEKLIRFPVSVQHGVLAVSAVFIPMPFVFLLLLPYWIPALAVAFFLSGIGFGLLRVTMRKRLIATQPAHRVGQTVASCNAYGFPVLALLALLYAQSWECGPIVPLAGFCTIALIGVVATVGRKRERREESRVSADIG